MICNKRNKKNIMCKVCWHGLEHKSKKDWEWVITGRDGNKECNKWGFCIDRNIKVRCIESKKTM
jgi:hypothetical protein